MIVLAVLAGSVAVVFVASLVFARWAVLWNEAKERADAKARLPPPDPEAIEATRELIMRQRREAQARFSDAQTMGQRMTIVAELQEIDASLGHLAQIRTRRPMNPRKPSSERIARAADSRVHRCAARGRVHHRRANGASSSASQGAPGVSRTLEPRVHRRRFRGLFPLRRAAPVRVELRRAAEDAPVFVRGVGADDQALHVRPRRRSRTPLAWG